MDWLWNMLYKLIYTLTVWLLRLVGFVESFFDIFAGTRKVSYNNKDTYLIDVFFKHDNVTNVFWALALIAIALSFGFCVVALARKLTDVAGTNKQTVGQIVSNFFRSLLIILVLNLGVNVAVTLANTLLDRINYAMKNAAVLGNPGGTKEFSNEEYATMTRIYATIANYSVNPSEDSRYNVNACFNSIRSDLYSLYVNGFFNYNYPMTADGHHTWQSGLALLAKTADLTEDLTLNTYYPEVATAMATINEELKHNSRFKPVKSVTQESVDALSTDVTIFLISSMGAELNPQFKDGAIDDTLRIDYINGEKDYKDFKTIQKDFNIQEINYIIAIVSGVLFLKILITCIFTFVVRMFNLILLYISAPMFASSMSMDDGAKFQSWLQSFVIQLFSGFGTVMVMRLYLMIIPIFMSSDLKFFKNDVYMNYLAQLIMIIGGAWAVMQASGVITGILAGNPGMAAINAEGNISRGVSGMLNSLPGRALSLGKAAVKAPFQALAAPGNVRKAVSNYMDRVAYGFGGGSEKKQAEASQRREQRELARERREEAADKRDQMRFDREMGNNGGKGEKGDTAPEKTDATRTQRTEGSERSDTTGVTDKKNNVTSPTDKKSDVTSPTDKKSNVTSPTAKKSDSVPKKTSNGGTGDNQKKRSNSPEPGKRGNQGSTAPRGGSQGSTTPNMRPVKKPTTPPNSSTGNQNQTKTSLNQGSSPMQMSEERFHHLFGPNEKMPGNQKQGNSSTNVTGNQNQGNGPTNVTGNQNQGNDPTNVTNQQSQPIVANRQEQRNTTNDKSTVQNQGNSSTNVTGNQNQGNGPTNVTNQQSQPNVANRQEQRNTTNDKSMVQNQRTNPTNTTSNQNQGNSSTNVTGNQNQGNGPTNVTNQQNQPNVAKRQEQRNTTNDRSTVQNQRTNPTNVTGNQKQGNGPTNVTGNQNQPNVANRQGQRNTTNDRSTVQNQRNNPTNVTGNQSQPNVRGRNTQSNDTRQTRQSRFVNQSGGTAQRQGRTTERSVPPTRNRK